MANRRLGDESRGRTNYHGFVHFLMPDGEHLRVQCDARYARERWQGSVNLAGLERRLEQGDVCRIAAEPLGELRVIIVEEVGTRRYEFIALVKPDPFEAL
jgi:hypothetical protein